MGGTVGGPLSWAQIKLVDAPEMGYLAENDKGEVSHPAPSAHSSSHVVDRVEILIRGPCVMDGYYRNEAATAETIDNEG